MTGVALTVLVVAVVALLLIVGLLCRAIREARADVRAARRMARREVQELTVELSTARAELHALRRAVDADTTTAPDGLPALDLTTLRRVWALEPGDFDTPGSAR